jgi:hypothetical protein
MDIFRFGVFSFAYKGIEKQTIQTVQTTSVYRVLTVQTTICSLESDITS